MKYLAITLIIMLGALHLKSQNYLINPLIEQDGYKLDELKNNDDNLLDYQAIGINLDAVGLNNVHVRMFNANVSLTENRIESRGKADYSFFGFSQDKLYSLIMVVKGKSIRGIMRGPYDYFYEIISKDGLSYAKLMDASILGSLKCGNISTNNNENINPQFPRAFPESENVCKIRVLLLYKNEVSDEYKDELWLRLVEDVSNQVLLSSNIPYEIEIVYAGDTDYDAVGGSSGAYIDLMRFRTRNDGYMDEVHDLRDKYSADICGLIGYIGFSISGLAFGIKLSSEKSFFLCTGSGGTSQWTFIHEIAHIVGARHDMSTDPKTIPYVYGHGHADYINHFRTVMAYTTLCQRFSTYCTKIPYFSNPNLTYNGFPLGVANVSDNALVWQNYSSNVMSFRQPNDDYFVTQADMNDIYYAQLEAKKSISTFGNAKVPVSAKVIYNASDYICLFPGFETQNSSVFQAEIKPVFDCGQPDGEPTDYDTITLPDEELVSKRFLENIGGAEKSLVQIRNMSKSGFELAITNANTEIIGYILYDLSGRKVKFEYNSSKETLFVNRGNIVRGIYFLKVFLNNGELTKKIVFQ